ncbi:MAG: acetyl esterase [Betaproteobacteria bacterium]|jgi:acetyl esterase/lipase|nr:acetyl esterase [Betaproteobacteria bacterium]
MDKRSFLKTIGVTLGAAVPGVAASKAGYDPAARMAVKVSEIEYRRTARGRSLLARVYQPQGKGPFPMVLDLHGGAWSGKDRYANEPMSRAVAESGVVVAAIDMTLAAEAPYPASVQDAHYAVRWLKWQAARFNGDPAAVGLIGSSTGGHIAELVAMRPRDARYGAIALPEAPSLDASVLWVAARSPISDPWARYQQAQKMKRENLIKSSHAWFVPWESIHEANPQEMLERKEAVTLRPMLIMQGELDDNVLPAVQEKFAATYRAAGGDCRYELYPGCEHEWTGRPGPMTDRAHEMVRQTIARNLG